MTKSGSPRPSWRMCCLVPEFPGVQVGSPGPSQRMSVTDSCPLKAQLHLGSPKSPKLPSLQEVREEIIIFSDVLMHQVLPDITCELFSLAVYRS